MSENTINYEFDGFTLDLSNKVLKKKGETVSLTPKVFDTLLVLVEKHPNLIEKDELMKKIWQDRFVEESNLTFNIKMLRKALGDNAANPKFIETIPRRGYRFIAEVTESVEKKSSNIERKNSFSSSSKSNFAFAIILVILLSTVVFGTWFLFKSYFETKVPILVNSYNLTKLSETGKVFHSAISPDGKIIAYTNRVGNKESLWLRQLETGINTELLEPVDEFYYGMKFSADGNTLFFTRKKINAGLNLYSVSVFGGVPQKIVDNTQGKIAVSNDGTKIAYIRYEIGVNDRNNLIIADIYGKNERVISKSESKNVFYNDLVFSPDDKKIAVAKGNPDNGSQEMALVEVDIENGELKEISDKKFFNIVSINWLPNKNEILISAGEKINEAALIWKVDYLTGKTELLRNDSLSFGSLNMDLMAEKMAGIAVSPDFHLFTAEINNTKDLTELSQARDGLSHTNDRRIVFAGDLAGPEDIWIMNSDGSNKKQLTTDKNFDAYPLVSADNRHIYFTSNRTGKLQIWRMNLDGTEQIQITPDSGGFPMSTTADGKTLYYQKSDDLGIWEFSLENSQKKQILERKSRVFAAFSTDASKLAFVAKNNENGKYQINIMNVANKEIIKSFPLDKNWAYSLHWLKNEDAITYLVDEDFDKTSFWRQNLSNQNAEKITVFSNNEIKDCRFFDDNRTFAVILGNWKHDAYLIEGLK